MLALDKKVKELILKENLIDSGDKLIVGVSGGVDSLSLLHVLKKLKDEAVITFSLHAAHLNHGLRGTVAEEDAYFVRRECKKLGVPCSVGQVDTEEYRKKRGLSTEDSARRLRYLFLQEIAGRVGASRIAVGHNLDDQVETVLLNFLRGAGLDGLTGMKTIRRLGRGDIFLIRPLLESSREEIEAYSKEHGLSPRFDETNLQQNYRRNRVRRELLPYIKEHFNSNFDNAAYRMARLIDQDRDFLEKTAYFCFREIVTEEKTSSIALGIKKLLKYHRAVQRRILRLAVRKILGFVPWEIGAAHIDAILDLCQKEKPHGMLNLSFGIKAYRNYGKLTVSLGGREPTDSLPEVTFNVPSTVELHQTGIKLTAEITTPDEIICPPDNKKEAYLDYDKVSELARVKQEEQAKGEMYEGLQLTIRARSPGDRFHPLGAPGKKKLKDFFIDRKIPLEERDRIPLVAAGQEIIWIAGVEINHYCQIAPGTKRVLRLELAEN